MCKSQTANFGTAFGVDAYSGAVMFVAFLSEMRRPMDFWKGLLVAQTFITVVYIFFGAFVSFGKRSGWNVSDASQAATNRSSIQVYHFYGQYAYTNVTQSVNPQHIQIVGNVLSLLTGWLAICK